jgi:ATP-dependent DNA helicase 2 subunit 2
MSKEFNININVYSKTAEGKVPTLKKHSMVTEYKPEAPNGAIVRD